MSEDIKIGDEVKFKKGTILIRGSNDTYTVCEIKDMTYILNNGWEIQKDWIEKVIK